jgi:hypothetical protein
VDLLGDLLGELLAVGEDRSLVVARVDVQSKEQVLEELVGQAVPQEVVLQEEELVGVVLQVVGAVQPAGLVVRVQLQLVAQSDVRIRFHCTR